MPASASGLTLKIYENDPLPPQTLTFESASPLDIDTAEGHRLPRPSRGRGTLQADLVDSKVAGRLRDRLRASTGRYGRQVDDRALEENEHEALRFAHQLSFSQPAPVRRRRLRTLYAHRAVGSPSAIWSRKSHGGPEPSVPASGALDASGSKAIPRLALAGRVRQAIVLGRIARSIFCAAAEAMRRQAFRGL